MKKTLSLVFLLLIITPLSSYTQDGCRKHTIGIRGLPKLSRDLFTAYNIVVPYAIRYGYNINPHITTGADISGTYQGFLRDSQKGIHSFSFEPGLYARYSFFPELRISLFAESEVYGQFIRYSYDSVYNGDISELETDRVGISGSPGLTIKSKNRLISLDLMYTFSNIPQAYNKHGAFAWRFNFNF